MLGINNLSDAAKSQQRGEFYVCTGHSLATLAPLLCHRDAGQPPLVLATSYSVGEYWSALDDGDAVSAVERFMQQHCQRLLFRDTKAEQPPQFKELLPSLKAANITPGSDIYLMIDEQCLPQGNIKQRQRQFAQWQQWTRAGQHKLLILVCGDIDCGELQRSNTYISGLATLTADDANSYQYHSHFWRTASTCSGTQRYTCELDQHYQLNARALPSTSLESTSLHGHDAHDIYATASALGSANTGSAPLQQFDSNAELVAALRNLHAATIIFCCDRSTDVPQLASYCYRLRRQYGAGLKLLVRQQQRSLRSSDERRLLAAGANSVAASTLTDEQFSNQIYALQGQVFNRELADNLEQLLQHWSGSTESGYLPPRDFLSIIEQHPADGQISCLLKFSVRSEIGPGRSLSLFSIQRNGDLITRCDDHIYLWLLGCSTAKLDKALGFIVTLPYRELFSQHQLIESAADHKAARQALLQCDKFFDQQTGQRWLQHGSDVEPQQHDDRIQPTNMAQPKPLKLSKTVSKS